MKCIFRLSCFLCRPLPLPWPRNFSGSREGLHPFERGSLEGPDLRGCEFSTSVGPTSLHGDGAEPVSLREQLPQEALLTSTPAPGAAPRRAVCGEEPRHPKLGPIGPTARARGATPLGPAGGTGVSASGGHSMSTCCWANCDKVSQCLPRTRDRHSQPLVRIVQNHPLGPLSCAVC